MKEMTREDALEYALRNVLEKLPPMILKPVPVVYGEPGGMLDTSPGQSIEFPAFQSAVKYARDVLSAWDGSNG